MPADPNNTQNQGGLVGLFQGIQRPLVPSDMNSLSPGVQKWIRDLTDYLRRLLSKFTPANILITINQGTPGVIVDFRYNAASHTFQLKRVQDNGTIGDWADAGGDQPVPVAPLTESVYLDGTELKTIEVASAYVLEKGAESVTDTGCGCGDGGGGGGGGACCTTDCGCKYSAGTIAKATIVFNTETTPYSVGNDIPLMQETDDDGNVVACGTFKATNVISPSDGTAYDITATSTCADGVVRWQIVVNFHGGAVTHESVSTIADCGGFIQTGNDIYILNVATSDGCP